MKQSFFPIKYIHHPRNTFPPSTTIPEAQRFSLLPTRLKIQKAKKICFFGYFIVHYRGFILLQNEKQKGNK